MVKIDSDKSGARVPVGMRRTVTELTADDKDFLIMKLPIIFVFGITLVAGMTGLPTEAAQDAKDEKAREPSPRKTEGGEKASGPVWFSDYDKAAATAAKEGKDLLLVFTGTDWIQICKVFYQNVLSSPDFSGPVAHKFVLVKLEYEKRPGGTDPKTATRNRMLQSIYRVRGFPTVLLTDAKGRLYGINGYQPVAAKDYAGVIMAMYREKQKNFDLMATARSLSGLEKAKTLSKGIPRLPGNLSARFYRPEMEAAIAADPDNASGAISTYRKLVADVQYADEMAQLRQNVEWSKMLKLSDKYISDQKLVGQTMQRVLMNKVAIYGHLKNNEGAVKTLLKIVKVDPESKLGKNAQNVLDKYRVEKLQEELAPKLAPKVTPQVTPKLAPKE